MTWKIENYKSNLKELNPTQVSENTCCSWIEEIIFLKCPYNSKPSMDLMQSLLKSKWNFFTYMVNIILKFIIKPQKILKRENNF